MKIQYSIFGCENLGVLCRASHQPYHISCGLSELWERTGTLDKHVSTLLVLIQEKNKPSSNQDNILQKKPTGKQCR